MRLLLALAGVSGFAWVVLSLLARRGWLGFGKGFGRGPSRLQVIERLALSPRRQLYLVQVDSRVFLLGAGEAGPPALIAELESGPDRPLRAAARTMGAAG